MQMKTINYKNKIMEKNQHKAFMTNNKLESDAFSDPVQKKIKIFDKMHSKLEDTVAEDRKELLKQLKELDHEIHQDMLNELEDELENNDVVEEPEKKPEPKKEEKPNGEDMPKATSKKPAPPAALKKGSSDEEILDELWKIGRTRGLSRSFLKECGVKTNITGWTVPIGKYALHRTAVFSYKYNLEKLK
jgi:hypothetical protein